MEIGDEGGPVNEISPSCKTRLASAGVRIAASPILRKAWNIVAYTAFMRAASYGSRMTESHALMRSDVVSSKIGRRGSWEPWSF